MEYASGLEPFAPLGSVYIYQCKEYQQLKLPPFLLHQDGYKSGAQFFEMPRKGFDNPMKLK
jgi:hypothetical protein